MVQRTRAYDPATMPSLLRAALAPPESDHQEVPGRVFQAHWRSAMPGRTAYSLGKPCTLVVRPWLPRCTTVGAQSNVSSTLATLCKLRHH
jgi:hypothetical protein